MTKRIFRSVCTISLAAILVCLVLIMGMLYSHLNDEMLNELKNEAEYIGAAVETVGTAYLENLEITEKRITLITSEGTVLFDNEVNKDNMENHLEREEVKAALKNGSGSSVRMSDTLMEKTVYFALLLKDGLVLRIAVNYNSMLSMVFTILHPMLVVTAAVIILSGVVAYSTSKRITGPINAIDFDRPMDNVVYDELRPLLARLQLQNETIAAQLASAKQKQEEFRLITKEMSEGIIICDNSGLILSCNSIASGLSGIKEDRNSKIEDISNEEIKGAMERALAGEHAESLLNLDGRVYQLMASPVIQSGSVDGVVILIVDETEKLEREKLRREFTANVSHELKTPLTSISGFAELIKSGMVAQKDITDFAGSIYDEAQRLITLVNDIIRLSRIEDGGEQLYEKENVDLYELARDVVDSLTLEAKRRGISMELSGGSADVSGIEQILYEMIYNICDNAIKYNKDNGKVYVSVNREGTYVKVTVRDTGIGIPPEYRESVFERFFRVDKNHSKAIGGTGLGLSIVKHGAQIHNAEVSLDSVEGEGTTITLTFKEQ